MRSSEGRSDRTRPLDDPPVASPSARGPAVQALRAPFGGPGGAPFVTSASVASRAIPPSAKTASPAVPEGRMTGAEIPITLLFVDIRGSTASGERSRRRSSTTTWGDSIARVEGDPRARRPGRQGGRRRDHRAVLRWRQGPEHALAGLALRRADVAAGRHVTSPQGPILVGGALHTGAAFVGPTGPANSSRTSRRWATRSTRPPASLGRGGRGTARQRVRGRGRRESPDRRRARTLEVRGTRRRST